MAFMRRKSTQNQQNNQRKMRNVDQRQGKTTEVEKNERTKYLWKAEGHKAYFFRKEKVHPKVT